MSMFKTRRVRASAADARPPVTDANPDEIEGVTLAAFATFIARASLPDVTAVQHETIACDLGFPQGRYDLIRNAWLTRVYSSPALGKQFGTRLDEARAELSRL